jgi:hypothetical protein
LWYETLWVCGNVRLKGVDKWKDKKKSQKAGGYGFWSDSPTSEGKIC